MSLSSSRAGRRVLTAVAVSVATFLGTAAWAAAPTHYTSDSAKSSLQFSFVQAGAQNNGQFKKWPVTFDFSPDTLAGSKLDVSVDIASLDTGDKDRNTTLQGDDLFAVTKYPQAHFTATQFTKTATGFDAFGKLTIRGVSKDTHIPFAFKTASEGGQTVGYMTGKTTIKRLDFGVGQNDWKSTEWVADAVVVTYSVRLVPSAH